MKRLVWVCCKALIALLAMLGPTGASAADDPVRVLDHAAFVLHDGAAPPADDADWQPAALPEAWGRVRRDATSPGWYRFDLDLADVPQALQSLYWPSICCVFAVHVNGARVGEVGDPARPMLLSTPQRFDVPAALLHAGRNRVDLRVTPTPYGWTVVGPLEFGPHATLRPRGELRWWLAIGGSQLVTPVALTIAGFVLLLWVRRRSEQMMGFFGLSSLAFAVYASDWLLLQPPMDAGSWMLVQGPVAMAINVTATLTALRYAGLRGPRLEWLLWALIPLAAYHVYADFQWWGAGAFGRFWRFAPLMYIGAFAWAAWRRRSLESLLLFLTSPGCFAVSLWLSSGAAPADSLDAHCYAFLPMHLLIVWMLVKRHAGALDASEQLNAELEQRVAGKHAELEANYQRLRALEQEQAVVAERQRIMSDMHDGIGGQLISALSLVEQGGVPAQEVATQLRACIDDLRLTIDSLEPTDHDLLPALGNLRYRLDTQLQRLGVTLDWRVHPLPPLTWLTPRKLLHVLRILQEAFTNVIKHARADRVEVETGVDAAAQRVYIRVRDNGRGFSGAARPEGHGLANMMQRARSLGGELRVQASAQGTTLDLLLPAA